MGRWAEPAVCYWTCPIPKSRTSSIIRLDPDSDASRFGLNPFQKRPPFDRPSSNLLSIFSGSRLPRKSPTFISRTGRKKRGKHYTMTQVALNRIAMCPALLALLKDGHGFGRIVLRALVVEAPATTGLNAINVHKLLAALHL